VDLEQVMDNAEEIPLDIYLLFSSQGKTLQTQGRADVGEDRFYGSKSFGVNHSAYC